MRKVRYSEIKRYANRNVNEIFTIIIMIDIKSLDENEIKKEITEMGIKPFHAGQIFSWLHLKKVNSFDLMTDLSKAEREKLAEKFKITTLTCLKELKSADGTCKFLFMLPDKEIIESVLMSYRHGFSVCISSQVGCRMGCKFCASTIDGMRRNLTASEMLEQVYEIERIHEISVSNIVIMGSGEPMDNYDNVVKFMRLVSDEKGKNLSARNITVSTCGIVPNIIKFADEKIPATLAISLHAPNDDLRKTIMPIANAYKISDILSACEIFFKKTGRRVTFEYSLIDGVNDSIADARELAMLLKNRNCHVNLIPVNKIKERDFYKSKDDKIRDFKNTLEKYRINVTIRRSMGSDIDAACGQLRRSYMEGQI